MSTQKSNRTAVLTPIGWIIIGIVFMIFWELILTVAVISACCWFVWQFRTQLWNFIKTFVEKLKS